MSNNTVLSFSFDVMLKEIEKIISCMVVKREYVAKQYETTEIRDNANIYLTALQNKSNQYTYNHYSQDVLKMLGYSDTDIYLGKIDKKRLTRDGKLTRAIELQDKYVIDNYVEYNQYYRELNGLPNLLDDEFYYASDRFYEEYNIPIKPVHEFTTIEINQLKRFGEYDEVVTSHISDNVELDDGTIISRNYLKHLGVNRIDIVTARNALNFEPLFMDTSDLNEFLLEEFRKTYDTMRDYYIATLYNRDISNMIEGYDTFLGIMVMMRTIQTIMVKTVKYSIERNYFDLRTIRMVYDAYGIPFNQNLSMEYHKSILRNVNYLIEHKASDQCINELFNILSSGNIGLYRYYLVKNHILEEGKPVFKYKTDFLGNTTLDKEAMFDFYFQTIDTRISSIANVFKEVSFTETYDSVVSNDQYWIDDEETRNKLLNSKFNYIETKYLGISILKQMTRIIFETQYSLRLVLDKRNETENIKVHVEEVGDMDLFTCIVCVCALFCKKYGYKGNIIKDPTQIYNIYGFNVKEDILKVMSEIKSDKNYDKKLDKIFNSVSVNDKESLDKLFSDIMEFRDIVTEKMYFASTIQEYRLYDRLYRTILITDETDEVFYLKDGRIASTYLEWIQDKNKDLYLILNEFTEGEISEKIDGFLNAMVDCIPSIKNMAFTINDGDDILVESIIKLVMFFKSYSTDIIKLNTNFVVNDINNRIKFVDEPYRLITLLNVKSHLRGSFHSLLIDLDLLKEDRLFFDEKVIIKHE